MLVPALALLLAIEPHLEAPWSCNDTYSVTQGNGGATSHTGFSQYAWDFGLPLGTEIKAAHGGTVILVKKNSNVGGCSNAYANDANYVVIDHGDGKASLYLHLQGNSTPQNVGDQVQAGDMIGRVGQTGWSCGPHLHFQVQSICGSWWCQSVPSEFYGEGVIAYGETMKSENCGPCGATLAGGQTVISESDVTCFDRLTKWWWDAGEGLDGHHWFTYATDAGAADTIGRWRFDVDVPGDYEVAVHIPNGNASAQNTEYRIHHAGTTHDVGINQSSQKGWQSLGVFYFDGGGDELLELPDNTGESYNLMRPIAFDAVRFTFQEQGGDGDGDTTTGDGDGDTTTGGDGDGDSTTSTTDGGSSDGGDCPLGAQGCACTPGGGCDPGLACVGDTCWPDGDESGSGTGEDSGEGMDELGDDFGAEFGGGYERGGQSCACTSGEQPGAPLALLLGLLGLLGIRRRR